MPSLNFYALVSLLPLLALVSAFPSTGNQEKRASGTTVTPLGFQSVGDAGISAQMMLLGNKNKVYILDKTENNPVNVTGPYGTHPAWAVEYDINNNTYRTMDVDSNTFCAGGGVLGNGTWVVFGGNQPITTGGVATTSEGAYKDTDGGTAVRMLNPCMDGTCEWIQGDQPFDIADGRTGGWLQMTSARWYPTIEVLEDGSMFVCGGDKNGGYVNTAAQDNPTYEFFPPKGDGQAIPLQFLSDTLPVNLYPLTWLMPSGKLFMQANLSTILYDYNTTEVTNLPDMPFSTRVYPASAATAMLPLTPANNYTATIVFCGGSAPPQWGNDGSAGYNVTAVAADNTCVRINPDDENPTYVTDDYMLEGRSMGQFVILPDGTFWMGNGVAMGTAGYGDDGYSVGQSYGQDPLYTPAIYNYSSPAGTRWNRTGISASPNERMYHSTAILLPNGAVFISGSNPNKDWTTAQWRTRSDTEVFYPWYFNEVRPNATGIPSTLSYGGDSFNLTLEGLTDEASVQSAQVVIIRGGFNTHAIGFGQRMLQLESTYTLDLDTNTTTLHVSQLPGSPGPTLFQPGPAMLFVVVNGVPSEGEFLMVGSGQLGTQPTTTNAALPSSIVKQTAVASTGGNSTSNSTSNATSTSGASTSESAGGIMVVV
ncbi:glyoxal oxidase N-terminus-domain-containing protein [Naematelia encephala]|uniref:Glyoxal oxidase N-terminus-domain-containing protein n=1 Tax=Naematelia encephala TaxID=71784 RepID=A0A1Y2BKP8_9TREE|nr:glyoxal oxidase N-terminus-domain-containing protein [Naematelia encephala]